MPISFERNICCSFDETISREWFITNGLGGYAAGTVAGTLTRLQQGLLVTATDKETEPRLLLAKIDEEVLFDQRTYFLGTNEYQDGTLNPAGFVHLESFRLEEGFPVFMYRLGGSEGIMLEKRIWMSQKQQTTYIQYRAVRTSTSSPEREHSTFAWRSQGRSVHKNYGHAFSYAENTRSALTLTLLPLVANRPYDQPQQGNHEWQFHVQTHQQQAGSHTQEQSWTLPRGVVGCTIRSHKQATPYHILAIGHPEGQTQFLPTGVWYWHFLHRSSLSAGQPVTDDLYLPGVIRAQLWPEKDATLTIVVTTEELSSQLLNQQQLSHSYEQALDYQRTRLQAQRYFGEGGVSVQTLPVLPFADSPPSLIKSDEFLQLLHQAGEHLLVRHAPSMQEHSNTQTLFARTSEQHLLINAGYYALEQSSRETLIALPGLLIATRQYEKAQRILRSLARHFRHGLLPGHLPAEQHIVQDEAAYDNADAALWYFYALDKYLDATHDYELLDELYGLLADCISHYTEGTAHGIRLDPTDGLLQIGASESPLTWMNALVYHTPVTPRTGKPVEINALWYHALCLMNEWSQLLYRRERIHYVPQQYAEQSKIARLNFNRRFWYHEGHYLYDLIDGPEGNDRRLRPNQLLAISLNHPILDAQHYAAVLNTVTQHLLTPYGLRTLARSEQDYRGQFTMNEEELQRTLHQGAAWPWLIGPYIDTLLRVEGQAAQSAGELAPVMVYSEHQKQYLWHRGLQILEPFRQHMLQDMLGTISSTYSGDPPHQSGPRLASAMSIGEILRTYKMLAHMGIQHLDQVISA